jgi:hypothetical protein
LMWPGVPGGAVASHQSDPETTTTDLAAYREIPDSIGPLEFLTA